MDGIKEILWYIHRTIFELVSALIANVFIYFFLINHKSVKIFLFDKDNNKKLNWLTSWVDFFQNDDNGFTKVIVVSGIIILTGLLIKLLSNHFDWISSKAKENLELYPVYTHFKKRIDDDLEKEFGKDYKFKPKDIQNFIRYTIMEKHKEFDTFLWYQSTEYHAMKYLAVTIIFTSIILLPFLCFENEFILWQYILFAIVGAPPFLALEWLLRKKIDEINLSEYETKNDSTEENDNEKFKLRFKETNWNLIGCIAAGLLLNYAATKIGYFPINSFLFIYSINLFLIIPIYFLLIGVFLANRSFKKILLDTYISIRYGKELFNEEK